jgi:uncharacterized membrane protein
VALHSSERLIIFSDGVMAVAITLLVLDIRLPVDGVGLSDRELFSALVATVPRILAYALSFLVVAAFWSSHHQKFYAMPKVDTALIWLNVLFLLLIGLVPFVTSILADNGNSTATITYAALMCAMACVLAVMWAYAGRRGLIDPAWDAARRRRILTRSVVLAAVFLLSIPVALIDASWGEYFWLLLIPASLGRAFGRDPG